MAAIYENSGFPNPGFRNLWYLGIGNGGGKQGRGNQPPNRRYGPDTEIQYSRLLSKKEADTEFQYRPHIVDTDTIADAIFADAISETSMVVNSPFFLGFLGKLQNNRSSSMVFVRLSELGGGGGGELNKKNPDLRNRVKSFQNSKSQIQR